MHGACLRFAGDQSHINIEASHHIHAAASPLPLHPRSLSNASSLNKKIRRYKNGCHDAMQDVNDMKLSKELGD